MRPLDIALALLLFATVCGYLGTMPLNLQSPDESRHLDHAKRILDGDVLYRDVFDITTPGWVLLMTGVFSAFGTTLFVARVASAVVHGLTAVIVFALCRRLGVRRELAVACALGGIVTQSFLFGASYHWLASMLVLGLLLVGLDGTRTRARTVAIGCALGLIAAVHQQRGAAIGIGVAGFLALQWLLERRYGRRQPLRTLAWQLGGVAAGAVAILAPLLGAMMLWAGPGPVVECVVMAPLLNYRHALRTFWGNSWGQGGPSVATIRYAWYVLLPIAAMTVALAWRRIAPERARQYVLLGAIGLASLLSIAYFPDVAHLALIASVFFVMIAVVAEHGLRLLPGRWDRALGGVLAAAVALAIGIRAHDHRAQMLRRYAIPYESAFGRVAARNQLQVVYYAKLRALLDAVPGRLLYVHPRANYDLLLLDARNPTRYDLVLPPVYTTNAQVQEILLALRRQQVPYIVWNRTTKAWPRHDLVAQFILDRYRPVPNAPHLWKLRTLPLDGPEQAIFSGPR